MRMMMKTRLDVEAGNLAVAEGSIGPVIDSVFSRCKPEAAYFLVENGCRTICAFFDLASADQIPALAEPMFHAFGAKVEFLPVMVQDDLRKGLAEWAKSR
jgi:hypothetical protein